MRKLDPITDQLLTLRLQRRLTQREVAQGANISLRRLQRVEQGVRSPQIEEVTALCNFYDLDIIDIALALVLKSEKFKAMKRDVYVMQFHQLPTRIQKTLIQLSGDIIDYMK